MAVNGPRRGRSQRALPLRAAPFARLRELALTLRDRVVLIRLGICFAAITATVVLTQGWKLPFPFRLDQKPPHGIAAQVDFQRVNRPLTARARQRAEEAVPFMFQHNPQPIARLPGDLRTALQTFAKAASPADLPREVRAAFGLQPPPPAPPGTTAPPPRITNPVESFNRLKAIASSDERLAETAAEFARFLQPVEELGLLRPEHFPKDLAVDSDIATFDPQGRRREATAAEIQLAQQFAPGGALLARWSQFPALEPIRAELEQWFLARSPETLQFDEALTQAARQRARVDVAEIPEVYTRGNLLVGPGETIDETRLALLQAEYDHTESRVTPLERVVRVLTVVLLLLVLSVLNGHYVVRNTPQLINSPARLAVYLGVIVGTIWLARSVSFDPWRAEVGPVLATVMIFAIAYTQVLAMLTAFSLAIVVTIATGAGITDFVLLMSASAAAVMLLPSVSSRSTVVVVGVMSAAVYFVMHWAMAALGWGIVYVPEDQSNYSLWTDSTVWFHSLRGAGWCLAAGFLVSGSLPFIESLFGVVTDISLLELGDVSHPLLQELVRRAPGTYNHSMTVATIGETAADRIGANGLLVRVGAYFHDIGKMLKPHYFVENMTSGENRHDALAPAMSTLIIIGHVKDGVDLAHQHNLPQPLVDLIEQHHGTTLVEYFFHAAEKRAESDPDHRTDAEESRFRYPGPRPLSREAAVLMIADAVEGASRSLSEPTPKRLERLVHEIALKRLLDGQFDDCGLTITELRAIEDSLTKSLIAMYHGRIKYPEQRSA